MGVLIKPTSSRCNLNCSYCFYLRKMEIYPWRDNPTLTLDTFETFLRQYFPLSAPVLSFNWQGGEPTMMGLPFYEGVVDLQSRVARETGSFGSIPVSNSIQTNATLLDDDWARFFKRSSFLVGVSLDGPPEMHDRHRVDWKGRATFDRVMGGIEHLRSHDVPFNILVVVNRHNVERPRELLHWLVDQGFDNLQFIPCVEVQPGHASVADGDLTDESVSPDQYGRFLSELLDAWLEIGIEKLRIRWLDNLVQMLWGFDSESCTLARTCGYVVLEHNGDCYPCDFFVEGDWRLGNIREMSLADMVAGETFQRFARAKPALHEDCRECPWLTLCYGECPRYRITNTGVAENSLPYFCSSFRQFFAYGYSHMEEVAVRAGRHMGLAVAPGSKPAGERTRTRAVPITEVLDRARTQKLGRNDPCPCGSGRKLKRCCAVPTPQSLGSI
jgi:uncharacterized protein